MPGDKIGVQMGKEYVLNFKPVLGCKGDVLVRIALRVDDGGRACGLVSNQIGSMRQARQIKLFENHFGFPSFADCYFG